MVSKGSLRNHLKIVCWLIERLREGEWYIGEIELAADEVEVLGFRISKRKGTIPGPRVLNPILSAPQPRSIAPVDRMLGAYNWYSQHGTARQAVAKTYLSEATKYRQPKRGSPDNRKFPEYTVNGKFVWTPACAEAWEQLKRDMANCLRLRPFKANDPSLRTYLITDVSLTGMAGYIAQGPVDVTWVNSWPIEIWARAFTFAETNFSTNVQEKLAAVKSLVYFEHLLRGVRFTWCTDHRVLVDQSKKSTPSTDRKLARWDVYINTFDIIFSHIPGDGNLLADTMSRIWEGYTTDEIPKNDNNIIDSWRWNLAAAGNANVHMVGVGEKVTENEIAKPAEPETLPIPSVFEDLDGTAVRVSAETLEAVFGEGVVATLVEAQKSDKLYALMYAKPLEFSNFMANIGDDKILRFGNRMVIPTRFRWKGERLFTELLTEYVDLEKTHFGSRNTLAGLKPGFIWHRMNATVKKFVQECDQCQRSKQRAGKVPGYHVAMPNLVAGAKNVAWDFQGPFPESKDVDGVTRTGLWNILMRGTDYVIMIPIFTYGNCRAVSGNLCPKNLPHYRYSVHGFERSGPEIHIRVLETCGRTATNEIDHVNCFPRSYGWRN